MATEGARMMTDDRKPVEEEALPMGEPAWHFLRGRWHAQPWLVTELADHLDATSEPAAPEIEAVLAVAKSEIGVEGGRRYCRATGSRPKDPWCVSFTAWCLGQVYDDLPVYVPTFCSAALRRWARRRGLIRTEPQRGDICLHVYNTDAKCCYGKCWHVSFVERVLDDNTLILIEGNGFVPKGERNAVKRQVFFRSYWGRVLFLRWVDR
jgi:hypothetical protein